MIKYTGLGTDSLTANTVDSADEVVKLNDFMTVLNKGDNYTICVSLKDADIQRSCRFSFPVNPRPVNSAVKGVIELFSIVVVTFLMII